MRVATRVRLHSAKPVRRILPPKFTLDNLNSLLSRRLYVSTQIETKRCEDTYSLRERREFRLSRVNFGGRILRTGFAECRRDLVATRIRQSGLYLDGVWLAI